MKELAMNLKTTFVLLICAVAGAAAWGVYIYRQGNAASSQPQDVLSTEVKAEDLTRIDIALPGDKHLVLERGAGGDWTLPGNWPTRNVEAGQLVQLLTSRHSRFAPLPLE